MGERGDMNLFWDNFWSNLLADIVAAIVIVPLFAFLWSRFTKPRNLSLVINDVLKQQIEVSKVSEFTGSFCVSFAFQNQSDKTVEDVYWIIYVPTYLKPELYNFKGERLAEAKSPPAVLGEREMICFRGSLAGTTFTKMRQSLKVELKCQFKLADYNLGDAVYWTLFTPFGSYPAQVTDNTYQIKPDQEKKLGKFILVV
jgi:hypothetical protein